MDIFSDISYFYNNLPDCEGIFSALDAISNAGLHTISIIPFGCERDVEDLLTKSRRSGRLVTKIKENKGVKLYQLERYDKDRRKYLKEGLFFVLEYINFPNVYIAFTLEESKFFH